MKTMELDLRLLLRSSREVCSEVISHGDFTQAKARDCLELVKRIEEEIETCPCGSGAVVGVCCACGRDINTHLTSILQGEEK